MKEREERYFVYFYYASGNELLYIGKSVNVGRRWKSHKDEWKKEVVEIGVREYPDHATMDLFEQYYIVKYESKYNVAGLRHGRTSVEVDDPYEMKIYSVKEFEDEYLKKETSHAKNNIETYQEDLLGRGIVIVETDVVDYFDDNVMAYDLDKVCFKYENIYLFPKKKGICANESFFALQQFFKCSTVDKCESECGSGYTHTAETEQFVAEHAFDCGYCYYETTKKTKKGVEKLSGTHYRLMLSKLEMREKDFVIYQYSKDSLNDWFYINKNTFKIDLKRIYQMENNNLLREE